MKTMIEKVEELLENGWTIDQIAELTGYPMEEIKKSATNWRNRVKTKGGAVNDL